MSDQELTEGMLHVTPTFTEVLSRLAHEIRESRKASVGQLEWLKAQSGGQVTTQELNKRLSELMVSIQGALNQKGIEIMATVKEQLDEFAADVETQFSNIGSGVDGIVTSINGVSGDVANLKKQIEDAIAAGGALDQATKDRLAAIRVTANALSAKTSAAATAIMLLDQQTEEVPAPPV